MRTNNPIETNNNINKVNVTELPNRSILTTNLRATMRNIDNQRIKETNINERKEENKINNEKIKTVNNLDYKKQFNKEIIEKFYEDIYRHQSESPLIAVNKYTHNVLGNNKFDDVIKKINDENTTNEQKNSLYHQLKAQKYNDEIESCTKIPSKFNDFLDISNDAKSQYLYNKKRLKIIDTILCFTAIAAIYIAFSDNNIIVTSYNLLFDKYIVDSRNNKLRYINMILNGISLILIFSRYNLLLNMSKLNKGTISNFDSLFSAGFVVQLTIELFVNLILIPPKTSTFFEMGGSIYVTYDYSSYIQTGGKMINFAEFKTNNATYEYLLKRNVTSSKDYFHIHKTSVKLQYNISTIILFFMIFRIYHFFRLVHTFSEWNTPRAEVVCKYLNCSADVSFGIRAILKQYPSLCLMFGMVFIILFFGIGLSIFEYYNQAQMSCLGTSDGSINASQAQVMQQFSNIYNSFWLVIVTMTTIGYGDIYPTTFLGRLLAIAACISGTFLLSLIVVFLNNFIYFDDIEKKIYETVIEENDNPLALKKQASEVIKRLLSYYQLRKIDPEGSHQLRLSLRLDIKFCLNEFRLIFFKSKTREFDLDGEIDNINFNIDSGVIPIKKKLEEFNKNSKSFEKAAQINFISLTLSEKFKKNSIQIYNLLKVLNKNQPLENLNSINEVYDNQADMVEEIVFYHKIKNRKINKSGNNYQAKEQAPLILIKQTEHEEDNEEESPDPNEYIKNLKKNIIF